MIPATTDRSRCYLRWASYWTESKARVCCPTWRLTAWSPITSSALFLADQPPTSCFTLYTNGLKHLTMAKGWQPFSCTSPWRHVYILIGESGARLCSPARCMAAGRRKVIRPVIMATGRRSKRSKVKGHVGTAIQHSYLGRNQAAPWPRRCAPRSGFAWSGPHPHAGLLIYRKLLTMCGTMVCYTSLASLASHPSLYNGFRATSRTDLSTST